LKEENREMDAASVKQWINKEIHRKRFKGTCGIASLSDVYNCLMPVQQEEVRKVCGSDFDRLVNSGSIISIAAFHTEAAIESINIARDGKIDYHRWNVYADEYNRINNALNEVGAKLAPMLDGFSCRATSELGKKVRSVEEYYRFAKISHRVVAEHAGIGSRGKNELIVTKQNGSAVRLNSVITPVELDKDQKAKNLCGNCRVCLDSCRILPKKGELRNYRQQCMEKINALNLRHSVCGICLRACYENGNWRTGNVC
jgi:epoxyqueuosine reductase QueG